MSRAQHRCPICEKPSKPLPENEVFPFCGARCKSADLSNWMDGRYLVPAEPAVGLGDDSDDGQFN